MSGTVDIERRDSDNAGQGGRPGPRWKSICAWAAIAAAIVLQYGLFRQYALREVAWAYPSSHDQTQYLLDSYDIYEHILDQGAVPGVAYGLRLPVPQGIMLHVQASLLYLVFGPGRLTALTLNFFYFALFQVVVAWTLHWLTRRWSVACIGVGLLLTALSPFFWAGGLMDFRIDFAGMCLFGTVIGLALRSGLFASRLWSAVVAAAAAYLILFRTLTVVYLAGILGVFLMFLVVRFWFVRRDAVLRRIEWRRFANLGLAVALVAVLTVPFLWHQRQILHDYYVKGHSAGEETRIRMLMDGHSLVYYPGVLIKEHAGTVFVKLAVVIALAAMLLGWVRYESVASLDDDASSRRRRFLWSSLAITLATILAFLFLNVADYQGRKLWLPCGSLILIAFALGTIQRLRRGRTTDEEPLPPFTVFVFLSLTLIVPLVVLTVDLHRSPVVANVGIPALLWLGVTPALIFIGRSRAGDRPLIGNGLRALAAVVVLTASWLQVSNYAQHWTMTRNRDDMEELLRLHDAIGRTSQECDIRRPQVALTTNVDYLPGRITAVLNYERLGIFHRVDSILGGYFHVTETEALQTLERCHFAIVARPNPVVTPFDHAMMELKPKLRAYCEKHLVRVGTFRILGDDVSLYARKVWTEGGDRGWVTSAGLDVKAVGRVLQGRQIVLRGALRVPWQNGVPRVQATLSIPGQSPRTLPATLASDASTYTLTIQRTDVALPTEQHARIHLTFDRYFVPKEKWISDDDRQLVLPTPDEIVLLP